MQFGVARASRSWNRAQDARATFTFTSHMIPSRRPLIG
jgi:hypothetical protein